AARGSTSRTRIGGSLQFHGEAVVVESEGTPECDSLGIPAQHIEPDARGCRPAMAPKPLDCRAPQALASKLPHNVELPQVDPLRLLFEQGIAHDRALDRENLGPVLAGEPPAGALWTSPGGTTCR